jgi:four helix bundle protein
MVYKRFEELPVWQDARRVVSDIYYLLGRSERLRRDFSLSDQLKRAGYSIILNIAEGFERGSSKEFAYFLNVAKGSAGEVRTILYIIEDNRYVKNSELVQLQYEVEAVSTQLSNFRSFILRRQ